MSRGKVTVEERIEAAKACAEGQMGQAEVARRLGIDVATVWEWVIRYKVQGVLAFRKQEYNRIYSEELKAAAVKDYLSGTGSQTEIRKGRYAVRKTGRAVWRCRLIWKKR